MPQRPPRICPGCNKIVSAAGPCPTCKRTKRRRENTSRPSTDRLYSTSRWQKIRKIKLARNPLCEMCQSDGRTTEAILVDHVEPVRDGGAMFDITNLQSLCNQCHDVKTARDLENRASNT